MLTGVLGFPGRPHGLKGIQGRNQVKDGGMREDVLSGGWHESCGRASWALSPPTTPQESGLPLNVGH